MSVKIQQNIPFKNIAKGASSEAFVDKLISFLEKYIPSFVLSYAPESLLSSNEENISLKLYLYLQRMRRFNTENIEYPFEFQPETPQRLMNKGHKRRTDMGIRINTLDINMELIYCIEAKRLPTDTAGGKREKEYVIGDFGGINRFKKNLHGISDDGKLLSRNGMIAYIQDFDFNYWLSEVNKWIKNDSSWGVQETLKKIYFNKIAKLESTHLREDMSSVELTHFWIIIN